MLAGVKRNGEMSGRLTMVCHAATSAVRAAHFPLDEIAAAEPKAVRAWTSDPDAAPHGGESVSDLLRRIEPWLTAAAGNDQRAVAVTHASVIRAAIILAIDARPVSFWRIDVAPL